jgi:hypothetical protein
MQVSHSLTKTIHIAGAKALDPITVFIDAGTGSGQMTIICYGMAWTAYWGAIGNETVAHFVIGCDSSYLVNRLTPNDRKTKKSEQTYMLRIVKAVQEALTKLEVAP